MKIILTGHVSGFHWGTLSFLIGLVWAYFYGWYMALIFAPFYNFFHRKSTV